MNRLTLHAPFSPSGDQPKAIEDLTNNYLRGMRSQTLLGVTGSGKTYTMAGVIQNLQIPALILCPNKTLAAQLFREFKEFFPENAVEYFVSYFNYYQPEAYVPQRNLYIEKESRVNDELDRMRVSTVASLMQREDVIVISSVSCIYGLGAPTDYKDLVLLVTVGMDIDVRQISQHLIRILYEERDFTLERASFRYHDSCIDIHAAYSKDMIRIEIENDKVTSIKNMQFTTGAVLEEMDRIVVYPAKLFMTTDNKIDLALENIEIELIERLQELRAGGKTEEADRLESRVRFDLDMMSTAGYCNGMENYSRHLTFRKPGERPFTLLDYFPDNYLTIFDESHIAIPQLGAMYAGDHNRKRTLVEFGFRLPSALDHRPLKSEEFFNISDKMMFVSATPADFEIERSEAVIEQIIRPTGLLDPIVEVRPSEGQIADVIAEARLRVTKNERVIVTTLTKKMAENLTEHLIEAGLKVAYIHSDVDTIRRTEILRELRQGIFDVIVGINLLREGIDLPEVSLVCILDADKIGFLRSTRSLIQIIGRSARNDDGMVFMYADVVSSAMKEAMRETSRRRKLQIEHNKEHGITPKTIRKEIKEILERKIDPNDTKKAIRKEIREVVKSDASDQEKMIRLEERMLDYSERLLFVEAALFRDEIQRLQKRIEKTAK
ncbi:MAG: excinuclease ABC subunit UvrB [Brevinema sp.]